MRARYVGAPEPLGYEDAGNKDNPCMGVIFSMLGAGSVDACHQALVNQGMSEPDGTTRIPDEGGTVAIAETGDIVTFASPELSLSASSVLSKASKAFESANALVCAVLLDSDDPEKMHYLLLAGELRGEGEIDAIVVGDSLEDGVQQPTPAQLSERLEATIDSLGAAYTWEISVEHLDIGKGVV